ncbi:MAG TPA: hypothetical protein HA362_06555 [Nanoarchaeota archaeon]|nr:hypothetical protein [Nanoarchaeota archaeon]
MAEHTTETIRDALNANTDSLAFMGRIGDASMVQEQTMHQVFKVTGEAGNFYAKLGKPQEKDHGAREMMLEAQWYNRIRDSFGIQGAPSAVYAVLPGDTHVMAVQEVRGRTYDKILRDAAALNNDMSALFVLIAASAKVSAKGYEMHLRDKEGTPAFFGEFDDGECKFLNGRTLKILRASLSPDAAALTGSLEKALDFIRPAVTAEEIRSFYRDAIPLNWICSEQAGLPVPIDLGSTSYRPVQFELVALLETPKCGLDGLTEQQRDDIVESRYAFGAPDKSLENFRAVFAMASYLKNWSGVASRIQHIKTNMEKIQAGTDAEMHRKRLADNIEGRDFHIKRALAANRKLSAALRGSGLASDFTATEAFLEGLAQGKYL